jgi:hypothetical protein
MGISALYYCDFARVQRQLMRVADGIFCSSEFMTFSRAEYPLRHAARKHLAKRFLTAPKCSGSTRDPCMGANCFRVATTKIKGVHYLSGYFAAYGLPDWGG